jgi:hypothetical protein
MFVNPRSGLRAVYGAVFFLLRISNQVSFDDQREKGHDCLPLVSVAKNSLDPDRRGSREKNGTVYLRSSWLGIVAGFADENLEKIKRRIIRATKEREYSTENGVRVRAKPDDTSLVRRKKRVRWIKGENVQRER